MRSETMKKIFCILAFAGAFLLEGAPDTVYASKFGFDPADATKCLQKAIDSGAKKVIVENMGTPWNVLPIKLRSDQHILFKAGTIVQAVRGKYHGKGDSLFTAVNSQGITLEGEKGATLRMWKKDYQNPKLKYSRSQWRNTIMLDGCYNVTIKNLIIKSSGGDGIYLGRTYGKEGRIACRNILIENCLIDDHHRQGISVISAAGLIIRNCTISNTKGTEPEAGIDFEPNYPDEIFRDILVENCRFLNNNWSGINWSVSSMLPVDITIRDCYIYSKSAASPLSFCSLEPYYQSGGGTVRIENCKVENTGSAIHFMNFVDDTNYKVIFKNVELAERKINGKILAPSPVIFSCSSPLITGNGGAFFDQVKITNYKDVPVFSLQSFRGGVNVQNVSGNVIHNGKNLDVAQVIAGESSLHRAPYKEPSFRFKAPEGRPVPAVTNSPGFRGVSEVVIWDDRGENISFAIEHRFFDRRPGTKIRGKIWKYCLISPSGKKIFLPEFAVPQTGAVCKKDFNIKAAETGLYTLELITMPRHNRLLTLFYGKGSLRWGFRGNKETQGALLIRNQPGLGAPSKVDGVFEVPAGVKEFWIDSDVHHLTITDPAGKTYSLPRIRSQQQRLTVKRPDAGKREIWKIKMEKFVSQTALFSENLPGIIAADPARLVLSK